MNELNRWMQHLLDTGVSAEGMKEFKSMYEDMLFSTAMDDNQDVMKMFQVIDMMGNENVESEIMRRYLYYIYGKFLVSDIYAGLIGEYIHDSDKDTALVLDELHEVALEKITKQ